MFFTLKSTQSWIRALNILLSTFIGIGFSPLAFSESKNETDTHVITLESTITGDKEQPAVSYFIPWKAIGTPDKLQWNMDDKHDDTLKMVDRDVMLRSMRVYKQMNIENSKQP